MGATVLKLSTGGDLRLDSQDLEGPIGEVVLGVRRERRQILARRRDGLSHLARFDVDLAHRSVLTFHARVLIGERDDERAGRRMGMHGAAGVRRVANAHDPHEFVF